ncbi:hypothetical protein ACQJBY_065442 [Aegilops geniculata]
MRWLRLTGDGRCWPGVPVGCCRQVSEPCQLGDLSVSGVHSTGPPPAHGCAAPHGLDLQVSSPGRAWDSLDHPDPVPLAVVPRIADPSAEPATGAASVLAALARAGRRATGAGGGRLLRRGRRSRRTG